MLSGTDPNWFFSTLSQSAAAIIGLLGGFFVSRLLQQRNDARVSRDMIVADFLQLRTEAVENRSHMRAYASWVGRVERSVAAARAVGTLEVMIGDVVYFSNPGITGGPEMISASDEAIAERSRLVNIAAELDAQLTEFAGATNLDDIGRHTASYFRATRDNDPEVAQSFELRMNRRFDPIVRAVRTHMDQVVPSGSKPLLVLLGALSLVGVIAPMTVLSAGKHGSLKIALLVIFALGLLALGGYLYGLVLDVEKSGRLDVPQKDWLLGL